MSSGADAQSATWLGDVSVVVLSYNRRDELLNSLPALCHASGQTGFELIVVDNASTDGSREALEDIQRKWPSLKVVFNDSNKGVAEGRNTGGRFAQGQYIIFIDDDMRVQKEDIANMRSILMRRQDVGVLSPRILHAQTRFPQNDHGDVEREVGNYHGACHMVSRQARIAVGEIDPLCTFGGEELDYSIRMRSQGYKVLYDPQIVVYHNNFLRKSCTARHRRQMRVYNFTRIHFKHFRRRKAAVFTARYLISHLVSGTRVHGLLFCLSLPTHAIRGVLDGMRQHTPVPPPVETFYSNSALRPDFGNVPVLRKLFGRVRRLTSPLSAGAAIDFPAGAVFRGRCRDKSK